MPVIRCLMGATMIILLSNCSVSKSSFRPSKKYSPEELQKDYAIFRGSLEESHPGIYWYTSKKEMDRYFDWGASKLNDSLNEEEFKRVLSYVIARVNCGHTVVRNSKQLIRYRDTSRLKIFPLSLKLWPDTAVVAANLNRRDSILKRGTVINAINNVPVKTLVDTFFRYISSDGYNYTHKYQSLSNRGSFGSNYTGLFGQKDYYFIDYSDSTGNNHSMKLPAFDTRGDSTNRGSVPGLRRATRSERRKNIITSTRNIQIDSTGKVAIMELGSFGRSLQLKRFFRTSFKALKNSNIEHLVIDVRGNGGGSVTNSTFLSKFIADKKFKIADSLYAINRNSKYKKYIEGYFFNRLFMVIMTRKKAGGKYHFGYFERHYFKPKKKNHFDGRVYILTGGNSFSATTLFAQSVKTQSNVLVVGEETGGGAYGNTAWLIPDAELPNTKVRFRLPLFRLVINNNVPKDGRGLLPDVESKPTVDAIRRGIDFKIEKTFELIRNHQ